MANLVVTSTTSCILVAFNSLGTYSNMIKGIWQKQDISFERDISDEFVSVYVKDRDPWQVTYNSSNMGLQIDSINASAPTSNSDLFDKLSTLVG